MGSNRRAAKSIYVGLCVVCTTYRFPLLYVCPTPVSELLLLLGCLSLLSHGFDDVMLALLDAPPFDLQVIQRVTADRIRRG